MVALIWLLIIVAVSLVAIRVGATALVLTGLSRDVAEFQAYSAFLGVGFTTSEAELVVNNPVRRRIVRDLMLAGQVGLTCIVVPVVVTFVKQDTFAGGLRQLAVMGSGVVALWFIAASRPVRRAIDRSIAWTVEHVGHFNPVDYHTLLRVREGYSVEEVRVPAGHPLVGRALGESRPKDAGVQVLGVLRADGAFVGTPGSGVRIEAGDTLTVYGREASIAALAGAAPAAPVELHA